MPPAGRGRVDVDTHKDGLRTFYLRLRVDGHRQRVRLGTDREGWTPGRAQVALEQQLASVHAGTWSRPEPPPTGDRRDPTFRAFASSWLEDNTLEWRASTIRDIKWRLSSHLLLQIGDDRLSSFDITKVTSVKTALLRERRRISEQLGDGVVERDAYNLPLRPLSHESINKCLALLARILDDAVERGYLADNPARRVRRLRHHRPRRPVLEVHEVAAMLDAADRLDAAAAGHSEGVRAAARLREQGLIYREIAERLSISVATVHYRLTRHREAGEPIPLFRSWVRVLCAAGLRIDEACRARRGDVDLGGAGGCRVPLPQPADDRLLSGVNRAGDLKRRVLGVAGNRVDVRTGGQETFGCATLPVVARLPERLVDLLARRWRAACEELLDMREHAERCGLPQAIDARATCDEQPRDVPAAVADGVAQRRAGDRAAGRLQVGAAVDEYLGDIDIVTARRPMQRRLCVLSLAMRAATWRLV